MSMSKKQAHFFLNANAKINLAHGAVRSGKTFITNLKWLEYIRTGPPGKLLMSGRTINTLKENVLDDIFAIIGESNYTYSASTGEATIFGRKIKCVGADNIESEAKIRGQTYAGWYGDEITIQHKAFVKQAIARCSVPNAKIFWTTNPDHPKHYIKTDFMDNQEMLDKEMIKVWHFHLDENTTLTDDYKDMLKASFAGVFYQRNIEGQWVIAEGVVYRDYYTPYMKLTREEIDGLIERKAFTYFIGGTDFGYTHPMTGYIIGITRNNEYYLLDEFYKTEQKTEDLAAFYLKWEARLNTKISIIFCDAAEPDRIDTLKSKGLRAKGADKQIMAGINSVQTVMKDKRFYTVDTASGADYEFSVYRYPDEDDSRRKNLPPKDQPLDADNHAMDAIRYAIHNHERMLLKEKSREEQRVRRKTRKSARPSSVRK